MIPSTHPAKKIYQVDSKIKDMQAGIIMPLTNENVNVRLSPGPTGIEIPDPRLASIIQEYCTIV